MSSREAATDNSQKSKMPFWVYGLRHKWQREVDNDKEVSCNGISIGNAVDFSANQLSNLETSSPNFGHIISILYKENITWTISINYMFLQNNYIINFREYLTLISLVSKLAFMV